MGKMSLYSTCAAFIVLSTPAPALLAASRDQGLNIARQQAVQRADSLFRQFDMNHDGVITRDEAAIAGGRLMVAGAISNHDVAPGIGGHTLKFMEHAFSGASSVTRRQLEQAMLAHFDEMDLDHDGVLTAAERATARAELGSR